MERRKKQRSNFSIQQAMDLYRRSIYSMAILLTKGVSSVIATNCRVDYSKRIVGCAPLRTCKHEWLLDSSWTSSGKHIIKRCTKCGQVAVQHEPYPSKPSTVVTHL